MTILVGYPPNRRGRAVLNLAATLARSTGEGLLVCTVVPAPFTSDMMRGVDADYRAYVDGLAGRALDHARADLPADVTAEFTALNARSAPGGLLEAAERHQATLIAVGSSAAGMFGHVTLSSVADRLLHSSPVPVAMATRGFRSGAGDRVTRLTVGYGGTEQGDLLIAAARRVAGRLGCPVRSASFAVQPSPPETARFGTEAEDLVRTWSADIRAAADKALQATQEPGEPIPAPSDVVVGYGQDWVNALDDIEWDDGEVLLVGSSAAGPIARVFLGSRAAKIIRHSPVPVLVLPRVAAREAAGT